MAYSYCPWCARELGADQVCGHCGKTPDSYQPLPHHFPAGTILDRRYWVGRVLGEGGFGITYLGYDAKLERRLAIKEYFPTAMVSRSNGSTQITCYTRDQEQFEKGREQFLKEARTLAKVDNIPQIVRVMDYFPANGTAYIVMEFLEGETLKSRLKKTGLMEPGKLFAMLDPLMGALERVHETGLIHRDISPDNIMLLAGTGELKLMDFGCARDSSSGMTMTVMLKPGFAPFEQYSGHEQGPWTDVYALCATMYYCITGKLPPNAMNRIVGDSLQTPSQLGVAISPAQEQALMKGLAVLAENRWQSVGELRSALTHQGAAPDISTLLEEKRKLEEQLRQMKEQAAQAQVQKQEPAAVPVIKKETVTAPIAPVLPADVPAEKPKQEKEPKKRKLLGFVAAAAVLVALICAGLYFGCTGWKQLPDGGYTYRVMGIQQKGWQLLNGSHYYFGDDGVMYTDWQTIDGSTYFFGASGKMRTDWQEIGGSTYFFGASGKMRIGWQDIGGSKYYFGDNGKMRKGGWFIIGGSRYYFNRNGKLVD